MTGAGQESCSGGSLMVSTRRARLRINAAALLEQVPHELLLYIGRLSGAHAQVQLSVASKALRSSKPAWSEAVAMVNGCSDMEAPRLGASFYSKRRNTKVAFVPPNPKTLERATPTLVSRASPGT